MWYMPLTKVRPSNAHLQKLLSVSSSLPILMPVCISMKCFTKGLPREFWQKGRESGKDDIKIQLQKLIEDHCIVYLDIFRRQEASSNNQIQRRQFPYLQHWQSLFQFLGRVKEVSGGFYPVFRKFPDICKILQGGIGLSNDRTETRARKIVYNLVRSHVCVMV